MKLRKKEVVFWDVDTQKDFMDKAGKLYVPGAEDIKPRLRDLTDYASNKRIKRCYTQDWHSTKDPEMKVFPLHSIKNTEGAKKIPETSRRASCVVKKTTYDVFDKAELMEKIIEKFKASGKTTIVVYGVATDYCVKSAAFGFKRRGFDVIVVSDAVAGVDPVASRDVIQEMKCNGIMVMRFPELKKMLE